MVRVALDIAHGTIAQMHTDTAPACTHEAGRRLDFGAQGGVAIPEKITVSSTRVGRLTDGKDFLRR